MFWDKTENQAKFRNFIHKNERFDLKMQLLPVDFQKPWWSIILKQKKTALFATFCSALSGIFDALLPAMFGYVVLSLNLNLFLLVILAWFLMTWLYNIMLSFNTRFQIQTITSVEQSAQEFFLTVDPICHSTKSTGQILSKIVRGGPAFEDVLDLVIFDLVSMASSFLATILALFSFGLTLGLAATSMILTMCVFNIWAQIFRTKSFQKLRIELEDKYKAVSTETVIQAPFVRATFASIEQIQKLTNLNKKFMTVEGNSWQAGTYINVTTRTIYILSLLVIGVLALNQAISGSISSTTALAIILTYSAGTQNILYVGDKVKRLTNALTNINDLFEFIRGFGVQSFPVLESENFKVKDLV